MNIEEAINKVEDCFCERYGTDVKKLASVLNQYAAAEATKVAEALLLASNHYCMNGIGEICMINNYELVRPRGETLEGVVATALQERNEAESITVKEKL